MARNSFYEGTTPDDALIANASEDARLAETSATAAASSATAAAASYDSFDDRYLGTKSSDPSVDNDSAALIDGALYFNTSNNVMMVYDLGNTSWVRTTPTTTEQGHINTVSGIQANVTTVAGISSDVTTVAGISSDVAAVEDIAANVTTVAGISSNVTSVVGNASNITAVAGNNSNITAVATNATNINAVAADATDIGVVAGKATEIGRLGTADAVADLAILGTTDVVADMNTLATSDIVADMNTLATSDIVADMAILGASGVVDDLESAANNSSNISSVANNSSNINTVAGNNTNINTVAGNNTNISTVATNITGINSFADRWRVASSAPTSSLDEGDLYYNTTTNAVYYYNGSAWAIIQSYSVQDGQLSQNNFTNADHSKLDAIEASATADQTNAEIKTAYEANSDTNEFSDAEQTKLSGIETSATADQTAAEIKTLYESNSDTNEFSDAEQTKLSGIETAATADQTNAEIKTAVEAVSDIALGGNPTAATQSVSNNTTRIATTAYVDAQVATVVDSAPTALNTLNELAAALGDDENYATTTTTSIGTKLPKAGGEMTGNITMSGTETVDGRDLSVDGAKLDGIEAAATADQTAAEIKTLYESNSDSNEYSDAEQTKLAGIATSANNYIHPTTAGYNHIPAGGSAGQILRYASAGTAAWGSDENDAVAMAIALG